MLRGLERRVIRVLWARTGIDRRRTDGIGALLAFALLFAAFAAGATPADALRAPSAAAEGAIVRIDAARLVDATDADPGAILFDAVAGSHASRVTRVEFEMWRHRRRELLEQVVSVLRERDELDPSDFTDFVLAARGGPRGLGRLAGDGWIHAHSSRGSTAVPEPSTAGLMGLGLALLASRRRRSRRGSPISR